jgi:hypothetical protein
MPIVKDTAPVYAPVGDIELMRYVDLVKFLSMLQRKALFFCRLDRLEDHFEGTLPKANRELWVAHERRLRTSGFFDVEISDEDIERMADERIQLQERLRSINCVSCWNKGNESAALWRIYSDYGRGLMIRSSSGRIEKSLINSLQEIRLSEVKYIDHGKEIMPEGNTMYAMLHKHVAYSYENEVRLILDLMPAQGWEHDWSKEEFNTGIFASVDLNELIEEIVIGPFSPKWYRNMIENLCLRYELKKPIRNSVLTPPEAVKN